MRTSEMLKLMSCLHSGGCWKLSPRHQSLKAFGLGAAFVSLLSLTASAQKTTRVNDARATDYGKLPLSFEANEGQSDAAVKFLSRGPGYSLFLTSSEAVLSLQKGDGTNRHLASGTGDVVRMGLVGSSQRAKAEGEGQLPGTVNYFIGNDASRWRARVPLYGKVRYAAIYPGVDLVYYGNQQQLEYDFIVSPGADAKQVRMRFEGAKRLRLSADGNLAVVANDGELTFHKPVVYQNIEGKRTTVKGRYVLLAKDEVGFVLGSYDTRQDLVIDPTLIYSTYLGGSTEDFATAVKVDASGNAYITGYTYSTAFPTTSDVYQKTSSYTSNTSQSAVFVTKLNATGTGLVYSTYLSGTSTHCTEGPNVNALVTEGDFATALEVDSEGDLYVTGGTCADNFPTTSGAFQTTPLGVTHHAVNAFVTKLNPAGSELLYSTYIGGEGATYSGDWANAIAIDASGNAYLTGQTSSPNFPVTSGAYKKTNPNASGRNSAFVTKLNSTGKALVYSTYLGGSGTGSTPGDNGNAIAVNASGDAYVSGYTYSDNFPVSSSAYQKTNKAYAAGGSNDFVTELNPTGSELVFSTYVGGSGGSAVLQDAASDIALDSAGNTYIAGGTHSSDFPVTSGAFQKTFTEGSGEGIGFVSKLNATGTSLLYSTYLGGSGRNPCGGDRIYGMAIDVMGNAFVTGFVCSSNFPVTSNAYQKTNKGISDTASNAFLTELNPAGSALLYSTYFGGSGTSTADSGEVGNAVAVLDASAYLAGATSSTNLPVSSTAYQKTNKATAGKTTAFIAKFDFPTASTTTLVSDENPQKMGVKVTFTADVTPAEGSGTATGKVDFSIDGGAAVGVTLDDTGHAAYATTSIAEGVHSVKASYLGDVTHLASASAALTQTIYGTAAKETIVSGSAQTAVYGSAYKLPLLVLVKDAKGDVVPGAVVTFTGSGLKFSSTTTITGKTGEASVTVTATGAGALTAKATVPGVATAVTFALTSTKAVLTISATDIKVAYNTTIPKLTYKVTGYVNGDSSSKVTGAPSETTTATKGSAAGTYPIKLATGSLASADYTFKLVNGTITITPAANTVERYSD